MTPKEKANDLVDKYLQDTKYKFGFREVRKECALIAVDELITEGFFTDGYYNRAAFWQEVKQEIEKL